MKRPTYQFLFALLVTWNIPEICEGVGVSPDPYHRGFVTGCRASSILKWSTRCPKAYDRLIGTAYMPGRRVRTATVKFSFHMSISVAAVKIRRSDRQNLRNFYMEFSDGSTSQLYEWPREDASSPTALTRMIVLPSTKQITHIKFYLTKGRRRRAMGFHEVWFYPPTQR